jgi:hypothetical protein
VATNKDWLDLSELLKKEARYHESLEALYVYRAQGGEMADHYIESCLFAIEVLNESVNCDLENMAVNTSSAESGISFYEGDMVYAVQRVDMDARFGIKGGLDSRPTSQIIAVKDESQNKKVTVRVSEGGDESFGFVSYAANGKVMVYVKSNFEANAGSIEEAHDGMALYYALADERGDWLEDRPFPYNSTEYANGFPFVSHDGNTLFYASDMPGGHGGFDLYASYFQNGNWTLPENLGPEVNTPGNDITPFVADGKLYFACDWLPGLGGFDVYSIRNVENEWRGLAHMGACVNSPSDDFGFVLDPLRNSAYFSSTRKGGKGHDDLYKIRNAASLKPIDLVSTESMKVPVIKTDNETGTESGSNGLVVSPVIKTVLAQSPDRKDYVLNDKLSSDIHIEVKNIDDIDKVRRQIEEMYGYERKADDYDRVRLTSNDLPNLNFEIADLNGEEPSFQRKGIELSSIDGISSSGVEYVSAIDFDELVVPEVREFHSEYQSHDLFVDEGILIDNLLESKEVEHIYVEENKTIEDIYSLDEAVEEYVASVEVELEMKDDMEEESFNYLLFDDAFISNLELAPQEKVFFIQLAALSSYTSNLDRFAHFKRYGNVYKVVTGGMVKIRLGYFRSEQEAVAVLRDIKKRGIREAFIVGDILDLDRMELIASPLDDQTGTLKNIVNNDLVLPYYSTYKVRVASYQYPSQFQTSDIADLGHIEHWTKGAWKIIVLSGYNSRAKAENVLEQCRLRGYGDAFVVQENNGTLERVE